MSNALHSAQTVTEGIHIAYAWEFDDNTDRDSGTQSSPLPAVTYVAADVGKIARVGTAPFSYFIMSNLTGPAWKEVGPTVPGAILNKLDATVNPAVTDDSGDGYAVGSIWINVTDDYSFILMDATVGAAVWQAIGSKTAHVEVLSSNDTTTSTSYTTVNSMTVTPPAGVYEFTYNSTVRGSAKDQDILMAFHLAGTLEGLEYHAHDMSGHVHQTEYPITMVRRITVNGSQAVTVQWKSVSGDTATMSDRHLLYALIGP